LKPLVTQNLRGTCFIIASTGSFVANDSFMKFVLADAPPQQVLFMRGIAACLWCLPLLVISGHAKAWRHAFNAWILLRAAFETLAVCSFIYALSHMPIGDVTAIFQISPLLLLIGGSIIWHEKIGAVRYGLIAAGLGGAVLIAQPGSATASPFAIFAFGCAVFGAGRDLAARKIPHDIPVLVATFTTLVSVMTAAGIGSFLFETWSQPSSANILMMLAAGFLLIGGHTFMFLSFRFATPTVLAPFYYFFTLWAVLSGIFVFGNLPNWLSVAGMILIVASGLLSIAWERRHKLAAKKSGAAITPPLIN
jgi:drug/metabolite transporter (DMT)-like permease